MSTTHLTTADDLWRMPRDGMRHELVRGELRTMSPAGFEHGRIITRISTSVDQFVTAHRLGVVLGAETGFRIASNPDTVLAPDVSFVRLERIQQIGSPKAFWPGAPDLAVEVVSPGDTVEEVDEKVDDWLAAGTRAVWVVKPRRRTVTVYYAPNSMTVFSENQDLDGGDILPGFRICVSNFFE